MSGARKRLVFGPARMKKVGRHLLFTDLIIPNEKEHIVEYHLRMTRRLGYLEKKVESDDIIGSLAKILESQFLSCGQIKGVR